MIKIGTRGSALALAQAAMLREALDAKSLATTIEKIQTIGDKKQGTPAASISDKREWIAELEDAVIAGRIDLAIHSAKDVPAEISPQTRILPILTRATPFDIFIPRDPGLTLSALPQGAKIGTSSLRRSAQLRSYRRDFEIVDHRGNVPTRLAKLENSNLSGIILAAAGLERLGINPPGAKIVSTDVILPAVNQGILAVQIRADRSDLPKIFAELVDPDTAAAFWAERICVETLKGDCDSSIGCFAQVKNGHLQLSCCVLDPETLKSIEVSEGGDPEDAVLLGRKVAGMLLERGAGEILQRFSLKK